MCKNIQFKIIYKKKSNKNNKILNFKINKLILNL